MKKYFIPAAFLAVSVNAMAENPVTPADMSEEAQQKMFTIITDYNACMMQNRLQYSQKGDTSGQQAAQNILQACEPHLDGLKTHLTDNNIGEPLAEGMTKKLRSKAARQLMTRTMNNLAAQAAAMENAQKMQQQKTAE